MLEVIVALVVLGAAVYLLLTFIPVPPLFAAVFVVLLVVCLIVYLIHRFRVNTKALCRRRAQATLRSIDKDRQAQKDEQDYDDA